MGSSSYKLLFTVMVVMTSVVLRSPMAASVMADITIYNQLVLGQTLRAHCWSNNTDFEEQEIEAEDYWDFTFGLDYRRRTRFDCTFKWDDVVHSYPIYIQTRDFCKNFKCTWAILDDGPCLLQLNKEDSRICYRWS
ncbi:hypothetical protein MLD38_030826 [Melastoma candidum]|uniref:Uncharacterized protein n=1 Tax=Melastoma candidum TaxID=119954 RepID=A0ACB9MM98_9MYRT|nr:hypothetical protein MLD38_030826 [Melastoma candidum]